MPASRLSYRISFSVFGRRFFFAFLAGREYRSAQRVATEGQTKSWQHRLFGVALLVAFASTMLMSSIATAYLVKSLIGVDVFEDHFPLHPLFFE